MGEKNIVVGFGEVLWDEFPGSRKMGGDPCNFVYHATVQGAEGYIVSRVGNDEAGHELEEKNCIRIFDINIRKKYYSK